MKSYAENHEDQWVSENLLLPESGVWVDVGCAHPFVFSQTAFLRDRGWTGIAIDGNPAYAPEWEPIKNAHFVAAVVSENPREMFLIEPTNAMVSRRHESGVPVQTATLDHLTRFMDKIDFLSLDVEGMEMEALASLNIGLKPPAIIVSEFRSEHAGEDFRVLHYLLARGYELVHATMNNFVFKYAR